MRIGENIGRLRAALPVGVQLVAVSKFHSVVAIMEAYQAGQRVFGENRAQELRAKQRALPEDIEWHFIGTLQRNKVKEIAPFVHTIQSVDSLQLLEAIDKEGGKHNRQIRVLLEVRISQETGKHGFALEECERIVEAGSLESYGNIRVCGLMGMASFTDNVEQIRKEFHSLSTLFARLKTSFFSNSGDFRELSMGMTGDYPIALSEGSTMVRIGSYIFGERPAPLHC